MSDTKKDDWQNFWGFPYAFDPEVLKRKSQHAAAQAASDEYGDDLPIGTEFPNLGDWTIPNPGCNHVPVDVGFVRSKWVCKNCDKELIGYEPENKEQ